MKNFIFKTLYLVGLCTVITVSGAFADTLRMAYSAAPKTR